jgi:hypothetical protein
MDWQSWIEPWLVVYVGIDDTSKFWKNPENQEGEGITKKPTTMGKFMVGSDLTTVTIDDRDRKDRSAEGHFLGADIRAMKMVFRVLRWPAS